MKDLLAMRKRSKCGSPICNYGEKIMQYDDASTNMAAVNRS